MFFFTFFYFDTIEYPIVKLVNLKSPWQKSLLVLVYDFITYVKTLWDKNKNKRQNKNKKLSNRPQTSQPHTQEPCVCTSVVWPHITIKETNAISKWRLNKANLLSNNSSYRDSYYANPRKTWLQALIPLMTGYTLWAIIAIAPYSTILYFVILFPW